jgi:hypothetical protein
MNRVSRLRAHIRYASITMTPPKLLLPPKRPLVVILGSTGTGKSDVRYLTSPPHAVSVLYTDEIPFFLPRTSLP